MTDLDKTTLNPTSTHGLTRRPSGLLVPEAVARTREVWLREEGKLLRRLHKLLTSHGVKAVLLCAEPACREHPAIVSEVGEDGTTVMVCGCKRREVR